MCPNVLKYLSILFIHYQFVRFFLNKKRILSFTSTRKLQIPPIVGMTINMSFRGTRNLAFLILNTHNFLSSLESRFLQIPPIVGMTFILSFRLQGEIFPLLPANYSLPIPNYLFLSLYKVKKAFAKQSPLISFYAIINLK